MIQKTIGIVIFFLVNTLSLNALSLNALSKEALGISDFQCVPFSSAKPEILSIATESKSQSNAVVNVYIKDVAGKKIKKSLQADRSLDQGVIYFTTDESILIIDPLDIDPVSGGMRSMYMIPSTQEQIPIICQNLI